MGWNKYTSTVQFCKLITLKYWWISMIAGIFSHDGIILQASLSKLAQQIILETSISRKELSIHSSVHICAIFRLIFLNAEFHLLKIRWYLQRVKITYKNIFHWSQKFPPMSHVLKNIKLIFLIHFLSLLNKSHVFRYGKLFINA